jgi:quinate dehydrogenase
MEGTRQQMMYIAGGPGGNSIGPDIHTFVAKSLGLNWTCEFLRLADVDDVMALFRRSDFAGGLVTMPHKRTIIPLLDSVDHDVQEIGACNFVLRRPDGHLHGTNTDWSGIYNAIRAEKPHFPTTSDYSAMIYGAGGASRGAVYALAHAMNCKEVYIVNRDQQEVEELKADVNNYTSTPKPNFIYITSVEQAQTLACPHYIISTVPDFEAKTPAEIACREILTHFLERGRGQDYVLLDMCYHPPLTRNLQLGIDAGWIVIPGFLVVSHQFPQQWDLWTGRSIDTGAVFSMCDRLIKEREAAHVSAVS